MTFNSTTAEPVTAKLVELVAVPLGVVTTIKPELAFVGTIAVSCVPEFTANTALAPLNVTVRADPKLVPVITTLVFTTPFVGEKAKMSGGGLVWPSTLLRKADAIVAGSA